MLTSLKTNFIKKTEFVLSELVVLGSVEQDIQVTIFSETLILESVNPQYDDRLFIEFPEKYMYTTCCVQILL